jgi:uncharacterized protein (TIGR02147 family)
MKRRPDKPEVFLYRKSHLYLADLILWYKKKNISLRNLSQKLNISPSLLSLMIHGKRSVSSEHIQNWAGIFEWNEQEINWLLQIIRLETSPVHEKQDALESMAKFKSFKEKSPQEVLIFKYLQKWWNVAIRELSERSDFIEDEKWIQDKLIYKVSLENIRKSLQFLNKHQLLSKYKQFNRMDCQGDVFKVALSHFHEQILSKAIESIYKVDTNKRHLIGHTMLISQNKIPEIKNIIDEAMEKIIKLAAIKDETQEVYHLALMSFPLTEEK